MSLLDILGNYYDSANSSLHEVPETISFDMGFKITKAQENGLVWQPVVKYGVKQATISNSYGRSNLMNLCNQFIPSFCVNDLLGYNDKRESFTVYCTTPDGKGHQLQTKDTFEHSEFIDKFIQGRASIPTNFTLKFTVKRHTDQEVRRKASLSRTNGLEPKEYFSRMLDVSCDASRNPSCKYGIKNSFKRGTVKWAIMNHYKKEECVFLAEYLYGVKVPKNAKYEDFFKRFANRPQSDFGIKDVQVLKKFWNVINSGINPARTTKQLLALGVKPATNLKRWYKKNPDLEALLK